jgi:intein-encoded DNA endonuclease-like protein
MSDNVIGAENQQGSPDFMRDPSETTRRTPTTKREIIAYLNGAIHDASLNKGRRIRFTQKDKYWLLNLQYLLKQINCNSWIYKEGKNRNIYALETLCKDLDFKFNLNRLSSKNEKLFYVRGFFDAEGGVPHTKDRFYIQLVQKNLNKIKQLKSVLKNLEIESGKIHNPSKRVDPDYWRIFISTKHHERFAKIISSSHPTKLKILCNRMKI